jgi:hypothetical protein
LIPHGFTRGAKSSCGLVCDFNLAVLVFKSTKSKAVCIAANVNSFSACFVASFDCSVDASKSAGPGASASSSFCRDDSPDAGPDASPDAGPDASPDALAKHQAGAKGCPELP